MSSEIIEEEGSITLRLAEADREVSSTDARYSARDVIDAVTQTLLKASVDD